jgi:MFS family permease
MTGYELENSAIKGLPWYRTLTRTQWKALLASNLGWLFDGFEQYALILTMGTALRALLDPKDYAAIPAYSGFIIAMMVLGWAIGGVIGGVLADYFGRKRVMIFSILGYSAMTGLSGLSVNWEMLAATRFLVGVCFGSEWVTGTALVSELWPPRLRGRGAGLMQCGVAIGFFCASALWYNISDLGPNAWRYMFFICVSPALVTLWIRRGIEETDRWKEVNDRRQEAIARKQRGENILPGDRRLTRLTLLELFSERKLMYPTIFGVLISLALTVGYFGVAIWAPPFVGSVAEKEGLSRETWVSIAGMAANFGAIVGYLLYGTIADLQGRKTASYLFCFACLLFPPFLYFSTHHIYILLCFAALTSACTLGAFTILACWIPELFPTRVRATAVSFIFNAPRFISWLGPHLAGTIIAKLGGYGMIALYLGPVYLLAIFSIPFLPETLGKPLPED